MAKFCWGFNELGALKYRPFLFSGQTLWPWASIWPCSDPHGEFSNVWFSEFTRTLAFTDKSLQSSVWALMGYGTLKYHPFLFSGQNNIMHTVQLKYIWSYVKSDFNYFTKGLLNAICYIFIWVLEKNTEKILSQTLINELHLLIVFKLKQTVSLQNIKIWTWFKSHKKNMHLHCVTNIDFMFCVFYVTMKKKSDTKGNKDIAILEENS